MREFGRRSEAAMLGVNHLHRRFHKAVDQVRLQRAGFAGEGLRLTDGRHHVIRRFLHVGQLLAIGLRQSQQHALETRATIAILGREVGASVIGFAFRSEKSGERPATLSADCLYSRLITAVHIGTLVAVYLDGDEVLVDDLGDFRVFIRLPIHHMTPVAPYRADIEQDGLVLPLGFFERFRPPLMPVNRLVHGRTKIGRGGAGKRVQVLGAHAISL